jgi:hypothetical protein
MLHTVLQSGGVVGGVGGGGGVYILMRFGDIREEETHHTLELR